MAQPAYEKQIHYNQQGLQMPETLNPLPNIANMSGIQKPKPSRLELMKKNYEKKRQKDVEDRLVEMRAQQARTDGHGVKSGGTVRAFFAERRAMEANMKDPYALPPIDRHFRKVKDSSSSAPPRHARAVESYKPQIQTKSKSAGRRRPAPQYYQKKSKGFDKQNPLPPLQRGQNNKPPTPNKRYETHQTLSSQNTDSQIQDDNNIIEQTVPKPPQKPNPYRNRKPSEDCGSDFDECSSNSEEPPPNLTKLKALRQKRLSKQASLVKQESIEKPTDFQKWQMQQDKERVERSERHRQQTSQKNEAEVTLSMRERELLEKIKAEQEKLMEIKRLQQELEEQERAQSVISSSDELVVDNKNEAYYQRQDSFKEEGTFKAIQPKLVNPEPEVKKVHKTQHVHVQKNNKIAQMTIQKPSDNSIMDEETEDTEPKENFTQFYEQAAENDASVSLDLSPCSVCGRKFATDRLARHEKICNKNSKTTRKAFDVQKQRVSGMEHEKYVVTGKYKKEPPKAKKADWRVQHENFIKTIRYAKGDSNEPPPVIENPHYVACPYCERKFNPETAERHIPRCKDIKSRPAPPKASKTRKR